MNSGRDESEEIVGAALLRLLRTLLRTSSCRARAPGAELDLDDPRVARWLLHEAIDLLIRSAARAELMDRILPSVRTDPMPSAIEAKALVEHPAITVADGRQSLQSSASDTKDRTIAAEAFDVKAARAKTQPYDRFKGALLLTRQDLRNLGIKITNTTLLRMEAAGRFPKRARLSSQTVVWIKSEIDDYLQQIADRRDGGRQ